VPSTGRGLTPGDDQERIKEGTSPYTIFRPREKGTLTGERVTAGELSGLQVTPLKETTRKKTAQPSMERNINYGSKIEEIHINSWAAGTE